MSDYDFPTEWYDEHIAKARQDLAKIEKFLGRLQNKGSRYHMAHVVVRDMCKASLDAMLAIPRPSLPVIMSDGTEREASV